jgi:hypothetical protein
LTVFGDSFSYNGSILPQDSWKFQERKADLGVVDALQRGSGEAKAERGNHTMWISLFAFACGAAVCLSLAAVMMQSAERRTLRG